jgi:hypothetical protein
MPTSMAERRHSLSLVKLVALQGITQPASAHTRSNSSTWSLLHQQKTIMFLALLHGEEFSEFHNKLFNLVASCVEATPGGDFFSLFRKECFSNLLVVLSTFYRGFFLTEKKITMLPLLHKRFCTGNIYSSPQLGHDDDGSGPPHPFLMKTDERGKRPRVFVEYERVFFFRGWLGTERLVSLPSYIPPHCSSYSFFHH